MNTLSEMHTTTLATELVEDIVVLSLYVDNPDSVSR